MNTKERALLRLLRPKDWIKNIFVFAPLFFTPRLFHFSEIISVLSGAIIFCMAASSIYILNDIKDYAADQFHPIKKNRPLANNTLSVKTAQIIFAVLSVLSLLSAFYLSLSFFWVILIYYILNIAYCEGLKNIAIVDIYCLAAGFVLRVVAGAKLIAVTPSVWILMCTGLLALFLALGKRRDDLVQHVHEAHRKSIRGYNIVFIDTSIAITLSSLLIAYTIYTTLNIAALHLGTAHFYITVPLVLFGILRYLQIIFVEKKSGSPTTLLYTDKILLGVTIVWVIVSAALMYTV